MRNITDVAVIGAGTMGGGIAISTAIGGVNVTLLDTAKEAVEKARARVRDYLDRQVQKKRMTEKQALGALGRLRFSNDIRDASDAQLVIEAVFEDLDVKRNVFVALESVVSPTTTLATNTSALKVSDIGTDLRHPERLCGIHYFSPAEINPVVEVIKSVTTAPETVANVLPFLRRCGKSPIECLDRTGFALNRFFCPYTNEAARCLDDGLGDEDQIDAVAKKVFGVSAGPFFVMNIVKPRINLAAVRSLVSLGPFYEPAASLVTCGEADEAWDLSHGNTPLSQENCALIAERLQGAIFFAVLEEISEGVAAPDAIDRGAREAFTFAKGPVEMMKEMGPGEVARLINQVKYGDATLTRALFRKV
ncbi:3-hydroxyacyl-CoA dehydrogenase NAD-binding domain-containing protein [Hoeflea sp. TYP-13]|uniref:3-hydroxyacyl-CoA dehydrogenase n=1 Tax=Hoeflea sp. TYP-13 TaxID=3230023 RepID=UPI0034C65FA9